MSSLLRKRKREDTEADDYSGGIETEVAQASSASKKHTMESDDEEDLETYNKKKYDVLKNDDIEGKEDDADYVSEFRNREYDGETRITQFNMNDEMEEGYFDGRGMYIWNKKDSSEIKDSWLDSVDWMKLRKAQPNKEDRVESDDDTEGKVDAISLYKECLQFLTPGESFLKAIKRLGGGKQMSASERLKQKKLAKKAGSKPSSQSSGSEQSTSSQEDTSKASDSESVNKLTELINKIMFSTGNMDIYEETFESVTFKIQEAENAKKVCDEDIFQ